MVVMDSETVAQNIANYDSRYGISNILSDPFAYLEPLEDSEQVHVSDIDGFGEVASRKGLRELENAGLVERNGNINTYDVLEALDEDQPEEVAGYLELYADHLL